MRRIVLWLLLAAWCPSLYGTTYYVTKAGSGSTCSIGSPCLTIAAGIAKLTVAGDVLEVAVGTYIESITSLPASGSSGSPIIIKSKAGDTVVWRASTVATDSHDGALNIFDRSWITIDGFTFDASTTHSTIRFVNSGAIESVQRVGIVVKNCIFTGNGNNGKSGTAAQRMSAVIRFDKIGHQLAYTGPPTSEISTNTFTGNYGSNFECTNTCGDVWIHNNTSTGNKSSKNVFNGNYFQTAFVTSASDTRRLLTADNTVSSMVIDAHVDNGLYEACGMRFDSGVTDSVTQNNIIHDIGFGASNQTYGILHEARCHRNVIRENIIYRIGLVGIRIGAESVTESEDNTIINNVVFSATNYGVVLDKARRLVMKNNIVMNGTRGEIHVSDSTVALGGHTFRNNLYFGADSLIGRWNSANYFEVDTANLTLAQWNAASGETGSVGTNPTFVDTSDPTYDFHLQGGSPAIGAGESGTDMGAYPPAASVSYYVSKAGSDAHACSTTNSAATNKLTIQAGIGCLASPGDVLDIGAGTYTESLSTYGFTIASGSAGNPIIIRGHLGSTVTVKPAAGATTGALVLAHANAYLTFDNLIFDNSLVTSNSVDTVKLQSNNLTQGQAPHHIIIQNSRVTGSCTGKADNGAPQCQGIYVERYSDSNQFINVQVDHNGASQLYDHGYYIKSASNLIEGGDIHHNKEFGVQLQAEGGSTGNIVRKAVIRLNGSGVYIANATGTTGNLIHNNLIYSNTTGTPFSRDGVFIRYASKNTKVYNNTITGNGRYCVRDGDGEANPPDGSNVRNNVCWQNLSSDVVNGNGTNRTASTNSTSDPKFVNLATADYRIQSGSSAKGTGVDLSSVFTTDLPGLTRVVPWDEGAYKYVDTSAPSVQMTGPANGATVSGPTVAVMANASDDVGVLGVQFQLDGADLGAEDTVAPYSTVWDSTTASNSLHTLLARARDAADNRVPSAAISVTVNNAGAPDASPTVSITDPLNGQTVSGTITVSANATDDVSVSGVQFMLDGANLGNEDTSAPYGVSWATTSVAEGSHTLIAVARDSANHTTNSTSINVTVSNPPPTISGISAGSITTSGATIVWTTSTASSSLVEYGTTAAYGATTVLNTSLVTSHSEAVTGLAAFTLYHYRVKSTDTLGQQAVSGDNTFTTAASGATTITVTSPAGGENWLNNSIHSITWTKSVDVSGNVRILVSRNGGSTYRTIVNSVAASALTAPWTVKPPTCNNCLIRVQSLVNPAVFDNSATFSISNQ